MVKYSYLIRLCLCYRMASHERKRPSLSSVENGKEETITMTAKWGKEKILLTNVSMQTKIFDIKQMLAGMSYVF